MVSRTAIFELRTYALKPTKVAAYVALSNEKFHLRTSHSILNGFWFHELGGTLNACTHIWQYDSLAHRAGIRAALAKDEQWIGEYVKELLPCLEAQTNKVCEIPTWAKDEINWDTQGKSSGTFEIVTTPLLKEAECRDYIKSVTSSPGVTFNAVLNSVIGPSKETSILFRHENVDTTIRSHADAIEGSSTVMLPAPWSPMK